MNNLMQPKSKKITSIATISIFILSMFFASVPLALSKSTLTLNPDEGPSGTVVTITGTGFTAGTSYRVYFDRDGDSRWDFGEPYVTKTADGAGTFLTTLTVPTISPGTYYIRAGPPPSPYTAITSAPFTVKAIGNILEEIEAKLDGTISSIITTINSKLGTFFGFDTVASLLYDIKAKLDVGGSFYNFVNNWFTNIQNAIFGVEAKLDGLGFQEDGGATAEFSNDQQLVGRYSVYLSTGATPASGFGAVREYVQMAFSDISDLSFWYRIDSGTSTVISSIDMSIQHPYWREGVTPTATGYFSPYFVIQIYDGTTRHWIVGQQWAEPPANADKWIQWKMTDSGQEYPLGSGMNPTQALWHDELWSDDPATGGSGGYPAGWEYLSYFQTEYAGYTVEQIKIGIGEFTPITEKQSAYVDSKSVNGVEHNIEPGLGNIKEEMPTIKEVDKTIPNPFFKGVEHYVITIKSDRNFQVKAVYFYMNDPDDLVDLSFETSSPTIFDPVLLYQAGICYSIKSTTWDPPLGTGSEKCVELLSYLDVGMYPAGSANDEIWIVVYAQLGSTIDGNESVYVKVLVETASDATVTLDWIDPP